MADSYCSNRVSNNICVKQDYAGGVLIVAQAETARLENVIESFRVLLRFEFAETQQRESGTRLLIQGYQPA